VHQLVVAAGTLGEPPRRLSLSLFRGRWLLQLVVLLDGPGAKYQAWSNRRLDDVELDYLFLDASHFNYHANAAAEPVLAAWGITTDGKPVFVGLATAAAESTDAWADFLTSLRAGGWAARCW
jgi:Transposase, Mutator family